ncbi:MAG: acetylglutamate kinase [Myxococcota bacterium]
MEALVQKARILHEAVPYIRQFQGKIVVIKYGGHAMIDEDLRDGFARDIVLMKYVGLNPVVVHGGGPQIDRKLESIGVASQRLDGLRITDEATMEVVEMVLGGSVNQEIVSLIGRHGGRSVGLTGRDDRFLRAEKIKSMRTRSGQELDPGRVGRIVEVHPDVVQRLVEGGFIPVIAPVAVDDAGRSLNVNADTVAGRIAEALRAKKLVLMTDIEGVKDADGTVVSSLNARGARELEEKGVIAGGMIPKVRCALNAVQRGVQKAHIIDGRNQHAMLLEIFTDEGVGTELTNS